MERDYFIIRISKGDVLTENQALLYNSLTGNMYVGSLDRAHNFRVKEDAIKVCSSLGEINNIVTPDSDISYSVYAVKVTSSQIH